MNLDLPLMFELNESALSDFPGGHAMLNEVALTGGKRFRPRLLLGVAACLGVDPRVATPYAVAAERIHGATLLHDDVIDESATRRGKPTLNAAGENRKAILGGDLLLARALREVGTGGSLNVLQDVFDVLVALSEGEWLQLEARYRIEVGERHLREVARKKTGSLIGWCCATPARLMVSPAEYGVTDLTIEALRQMGMHLGVAFQIADDCLDFSPSSGKPLAQDLREGQVNFVTQHLLDHTPHLRSVIADCLKGRFFSFDSLMGFLEGPLVHALQRTFAKAEVEVAAAEASLQSSGMEPAIIEQIKLTILRPFLSQLRANYAGTT